MTQRLWNSFKAALCGFRDVLRFENSFRIMALVAFVVVLMMFYFPTTRTEKAVLLTAIFAVLGLELVNSVVERILDFIHAEQHMKIRHMKDLMAAIVLLAVVGAGAIGILVFWPYVF